MKLEEFTDWRSDFRNTWLCEMPSGLGSFETYYTIEYSIKDLIKHGLKPVNVADNIWKLTSSNKLLYWFGSESNIDLGIELEKKPEALVVSITGKNPKLRGKAPYASQLYQSILTDSGKDVSLMSDSFLSDEGFALWKKMVKLGFKVSVYDTESPGSSFKRFETPEELDKFFKVDDSDFERYRYILSENGLNQAKLAATFRLRALHENNVISRKSL